MTTATTTAPPTAPPGLCPVCGNHPAVEAGWVCSACEAEWQGWEDWADAFGVRQIPVSPWVGTMGQLNAPCPQKLFDFFNDWYNS